MSSSFLLARSKKGRGLSMRCIGQSLKNFRLTLAVILKSEHEFAPLDVGHIRISVVHLERNATNRRKR